MTRVLVLLQALRRNATNDYTWYGYIRAMTGQTEH